MFIVEGADSLGKTTVAKKIVEQMNSAGTCPARYVHMTRPPSVFNFGTDYLDMMSYFAVQDRFHLGALAYHDGVLPPHRRKWIEGHLLQRGSYILILVAPNEKWFKQKLEYERKKRDQMFNVDFLIEANRRYIAMANRNDPDAVYYDSLCHIGPSAENVAEYYRMSFESIEQYPDDQDIGRWVGFWTERLLNSLTQGELEWRK